MKNSLLLSLLLFVLLFFSCKKESTNEIEVTVYKATGNIQPKLDEFRSVLGDLNTTPGAIGGRREVNWDGIPDSLLNKKLPNDFFNPTGVAAPASRQRGLAYADGEVQVSGTGFSHINPEAATQFAAFSGSRSFANVSSALWQIKFEEPGASAPAFVQGFGMVFSDVDKDNTVAIEFFNGSESLGKFFVPAHDTGSNFSFLGVRFSNRNVTHVQISHQGKLNDGGRDISEGGTIDFIVMDDVIYSEPVRR